MIDFHSHVLPGIDDGARDIKESVALLSALRDQAVDTVVATPHFYADRQSLEEFLERRNNAYDILKPNLGDNLPRVICGAEVKYYPGISKMERLKQLRIQGTKLLLLEMSVSRWTDYTVKEVLQMASGSTTLVIAHMERYMNLQKSDTLRRMYDAGILMQFNASYFLGAFSKRRAISMLYGGDIHLIGSDCHNLTSRPPQMGKAFGQISKRLGDEFVSRVNEYGYNLLGINK